MSDTKCQDRIDTELENTMDQLRQLWSAYQDGDKDAGDLGKFSEYHLCFDYVVAGTFTDQDEGYHRYQLSWGGPGDEFRIFTRDLIPHRIEYWFLDWFDGAFRHLRGEDHNLLAEIFTQYFVEGGIATDQSWREVD